MEHQFTPPVDLRMRIGALFVMLIPIFLAPKLGMIWRVVACFMPFALTGTFRLSSIRGDWFTTRMYFGFVPVIRHKCKLKAVEHIGTKYARLGLVQFLFGYIFDLLVPAIGGPFELWIETAKGREFVVWQGFSQLHFEKNLELLTNQTGASIRPK